MNGAVSDRYTLRTAVPAVILLIVLGALVFSYVDSILGGRAEARQRARQSAVLDAERLARITQRELKDHPGNVESDLSVASTEPRASVLALINPSGTVAMAHHLAWRGHGAEQLIAHFSSQRFARVVQGRLPDVQEFGDPPRISVMVPYFTQDRPDVIRNDDRGVVYLEYDLSQDYAQVQWSAQQRMWPLLGAALATALGLAWLIGAKVTRPLARVERASLELAHSKRFPEPLDEGGPREIARLAQGFNTMVARLRLAQQDSENSRARLSAIIEAAMDAIITVDQQQCITVINGTAQQMFGCTEQQVLGKSVELLIPERFHASHAQSVRRYAESGLSNRTMGGYAVVTARRLSGEEFPAEASISHIVVDGALLLTVILRDVTERQKAEQAIMELNSSLEAQVQQRTARLSEATRILQKQQGVLQQAHAEQRLIFDTVTVGIALVREHRILRCNRMLEAVFGYSSGALEGQTTRVWYADQETFETAGAPLFSDLAAGQSQQHEQELVRQDGSRFWARITACRLEDPSLGRALLAVIEDLSLQHAAQLAILQAKEKALEASAAKSHFLANMSHEIRTPLNAVTGLSYLLLQGTLTPQQREQVRRIESSSQHLLDTIDDILDYSKVEAGKMALEHIDFNLADVLNHVTTLLADKAASKGLELLLEVHPDVPQRLVGDPLRLGQLMVNYVNNAIKFTHQGQVRMTLQVREHHAADVLLYCTVQDTGNGLSPEQLPQLFQSFQQADSSTTRHYGGTGLGLAICQQLAGLMQGEVGAQSVLGQGSTFWFTVRLQTSTAHDVPVATATATDTAAVTGLVKAPQREQLDPDEARTLGPICSRLAALLADDDLAAVDWLTEHAALLQHALGVHYAPLADAVLRFDCAQALSKLRLAAQSVGTSIHTTGAT